MKITKFSQLKDGMRASCVFYGKKLNGVITIEGAFAFLCQNEKDGAACRDRKGYKFSVWIINDTDRIARDVSDIKTIPTKKAKKVVKPVEPVYTEITSVDQLYDGMPVKAVWLVNSRQIDGKITIDGANVFICQNDREGSSCKDKKGYSYSWVIKEGASTWLVDGYWYGIAKLEGVLKPDPSLMMDETLTGKVSCKKAADLILGPTKPTKVAKSRPEATSYMWDGILYLKDTIGGQDVKLLEVLS